MTRRTRGWVWGAAVALLAGCSDAPEAGSILVEITADVELAAATVELLGDGIQGVSETPGSWVAGEPLDVPEGTPGYRAVIVAETPGTLVLTLEVADLDAALPEVQVLEAVGADNKHLADLSRVSAEVRR